jgi:hypothetical protein
MPISMLPIVNDRLHFVNPSSEILNETDALMR